MYSIQKPPDCKDILPIIRLKRKQKIIAQQKKLSYFMLVFVRAHWEKYKLSTCKSRYLWLEKGEVRYSGRAIKKAVRAGQKRQD